MGGIGSGRYSDICRRITADDLYRISATKLQRIGLFSQPDNLPRSISWREKGKIVASISAVFSYDLDDEPVLSLSYVADGENYDYKIFLEVTTPHYGGQR